MSKKVLKFVEESITLEFSGVEHDVRIPSGLELIEYTEEVGKIDEKDIRKILEKNHEFLNKWGLPMDIAKKLNSQQTQELFKSLMGN